MASTSLTIKDFKKDLPGKVSGYLYEFPVIQTKNARGKSMTWQIIVKIMYDDTPVEIIDDYFDSKNQLPDKYTVITNVLSKQTDSAEYTKKTPTITVSGKNIGKANQTNAFTQALRDALGKYNVQIRKGLSDDESRPPCPPSGEDPKLKEKKREALRYPPMLVQIKGDKFIDYSKKIYLQRKYNGVRSVITLEGTKVLIYSRNLKEYFGFEKIREDLKPILTHWHNELKRKIYFDGEMYIHGLSLQDISGIARRVLTPKYTNGDVEEMTYNIYDCFIPDEPNLTYAERKEILDKIFAEHNLKYIVKVETFEVKNEEDVDKLFKQFIDEGYEGAILRKGWMNYRYSYNNYHSDNLLKIKPTISEEFKIVDYTEGKLGKSKGALMLILETEEGNTFPITPGLTLEERYKLYKKMPIIEKNTKSYFENNYKNRYLTVIFDEWSKDKIPLRTRTEGIIIRDYE